MGINYIKNTWCAVPTLKRDLFYVAENTVFS